MIFVHGLFGPKDTWQTFDELIKNDPELSKFVKTEFFNYESPKIRLRPDRRIAEIEDLARRLRTDLFADPNASEPVVLVTHSQGGLIVQRFLAQAVWEGKLHLLKRIRHVVMYSCPNSGSEFFLSIRKRLALVWRHGQEQSLRPLDQAVIETQRTVLQSIVYGSADSGCRIPILACGASEDNIVPPWVATGCFPLHETLDGDHHSVVRPAGGEASSFRILKRTLLAVSEEPDERAAGLQGATFDEGADIPLTPPTGNHTTGLRGRTELVASLMPGTASRRVQILAGPPGSGKSRLAFEVAESLRRDGRRDVWWVNVNQITLAMRAVAIEAGAPPSQVKEAWLGSGRSQTDLVWRFLNGRSRPWLLIFDNADDPDVLGPSEGHVADGNGWLRRPDTDNGMVIVTSRNHNVAAWGDWSVVREVPLLDPDSGAAMLMDRCGTAAGTREEARRLAEELGCLPLALRWAAQALKSAIDKDGRPEAGSITSFTAYLEEIRRRFGLPPGARHFAPEDWLGLGEVTKVLQISLELLAGSGLHEAAPLLKLLACLDTAPIPYEELLKDEILAGSPLFGRFPPERRELVVDGLADLGLIDRDVAEDEQIAVLSLHPLTHGLLRNDDDVNRRRADYYGLNLRLLLAATKDFDPDLPKSWDLWNRVAAHAIEVINATVRGGLDSEVIISALKLARTTSRYLIAKSLFGPAERFLPPLITGCRSYGFDEDDRYILALRHERGRMALERGDAADAESEFQEIVAKREEVLGDDHVDTWASRHKLARALLEQGQPDEAEPLLRRLVAAEERINGSRHRDTVVVKHTLARALLQLGSNKEAENMLRDVLADCNDMWAPATPETLFVRHSLARSLAAQERWDDAVRVARDALEQIPDRRSSPVAMNLRHTLATSLLGSGRTQEAEAVADALLRDREKALGGEHRQTKLTRELLQEIRKDL